MKVRFGFTLGPETAPEELGDLVDDLERLEFDNLWVPEVLSRPVLDPIVTLTFAAARTRRLKLGAHLIIPGRHPVHLARQLAHLDRVSNGRLLLVGVLGIADEADRGAQGIGRKERAASLEEVVPLLRRLWTGEAVDHEGPRYRLSGVRVSPTPRQKPLELWLGGQAPAALRRCGRLGDGWMPGLIAPDKALDLRRQVEAAAAAAGRHMDPEHYGVNLFYASEAVSERVLAGLGLDPSDRSRTDLVCIGLDAVRRRAEEWIERGFSKFLLYPVAEPRDRTAELEALAEKVLPLRS